jgi:hypothetical protein
VRYAFLLIALFFTSCATLVNNRWTKVTIDSEIDSMRIALKDDTTRWYRLPALLIPERSEHPLEVIIKRDTVQQTALIKSKLSAAVIWGNLLSWGFVGMAVDCFTPKSYTYPRFMQITYDERLGYQVKANNKVQSALANQLFFKISIPEGNMFYLNTGKMYDYRFGFLGLSGGIEYYYKDKTNINFDIGAMTDFLVPFPAPIEKFESYDMSFASYADIQHGNDFRLFHIDYGFQINRTRFYRWVEDTTTLNNFYSYGYTYRENNLGLALSGYFKCTRTFNIGINYYPSLYHWTSTDSHMKYTYLLFFEMLFKIESDRPVNKKR